MQAKHQPYTNTDNLTAPDRALNLGTDRLQHQITADSAEHISPRFGYTQPARSRLEGLPS